MTTWLNGLSDKDKQEMFDDACDAYRSSKINDTEFRMTLAKLGYNATDIEELERYYRPAPPENDGD